MNLPFALSAALMKDDMELNELIDALLPEAREVMQEFKVDVEENEDDI